MQRELGFDYILIDEQKYGSILPNGEWTGVIGALQKRNANFTIMDLTIMDLRSKVIDFTVPIVDDEIFLYNKRPTIEALR